MRKIVGLSKNNRFLDSHLPCPANKTFTEQGRLFKLPAFEFSFGFCPYRRIKPMRNSRNIPKSAISSDTTGSRIRYSGSVSVMAPFVPRFVLLMWLAKSNTRSFTIIAFLPHCRVCFMRFSMRGFPSVNNPPIAQYPRPFLPKSE